MFHLQRLDELRYLKHYNDHTTSPEHFVHLRRVLPIKAIDTLKGQLSGKLVGP